MMKNVSDNEISGLLRLEVSELARHGDPYEASWQSVRLAISQAATLLRTSTGQTSAPVGLSDIAKLRGIYRTEYFNRPGSPHGVLVPTPDGFLVRLPKGNGETRNRTTLAHEIGHTFFYDLTKTFPTRLLARPRSGHSYKEEDICQWFARELLLPRELMANRGKVMPERNLDYLIELANRFVVSPEIAAVRLLWDLDSLPMSVGLFGWVDSKSSGVAGLRLRKYHGRGIKSLRKAETALFKSVEGELKNGSPFRGLDDLAHQNSDLASIEWRSSNTRSGQGFSVLLTFKRDKVLID